MNKQLMLAHRSENHKRAQVECRRATNCATYWSERYKQSVLNSFEETIMRTMMYAKIAQAKYWLKRC